LRADESPGPNTASDGSLLGTEFHLFRFDKTTLTVNAKLLPAISQAIAKSVVLALSLGIAAGIIFGFGMIAVPSSAKANPFQDSFRYGLTPPRCFLSRRDGRTLRARRLRLRSYGGRPAFLHKTNDCVNPSAMAKARNIDPGAVASTTPRGPFQSPCH